MTITLTAFVISQNPNIIPTGYIVFAMGSKTLGVVNLNNDAMAILEISENIIDLSVPVLAYYSGDKNFRSGVSKPRINYSY